MFCVGCGTAVLEGERLCAKCGHAVSAGEASPAAAKGDEAFRKVRKMNIVGAAGMALLAVFCAVFVGTNSAVPTLVLVLGLLFLFLLVGAPTTTALALSNIGGRLVRRIATGLNIALIMLWALGMVHSVIHPSVQIIWNFGAALFYVWPEAINIRTLRAYEKSA